MQSSTQRPWQKILKFVTNPTVEVLLAIGLVLVSAWVVIETESSPAQRKNPFPILFGHK